jgi:hypothetical protein
MRSQVAYGDVEVSSKQLRGLLATGGPPAWGLGAEITIAYRKK